MLILGSHFNDRKSIIWKHPGINGSSSLLLHTFCSFVTDCELLSENNPGLGERLMTHTFLAKLFTVFMALGSVNSAALCGAKDRVDCQFGCDKSPWPGRQSGQAPWWPHCLETYFVSPAHREMNPVTRIRDVFFDERLDKELKHNGVVGDLRCYNIHMMLL